MVSVLASNAVDSVFEHRSGQAKDYEIGIFCYIKEKDQRWVGSESGLCVWLGQHVYPWTAVSVN